LLYSAAAAVVVQSRLHEPCSVYYFASFYVQQKVSWSFVPLHQILATPLFLPVTSLLTYSVLAQRLAGKSISKITYFVSSGM